VPNANRVGMRSAAKAAARKMARDLRGELVHAAGCVFRGNEVCATQLVATPEGYQVYFEECAKLGVRLPMVRVPKSLRSALGRTIGGRAERT
jgi:hypothetical protein